MMLKELKVVPYIIEGKNPRYLEISNLYANKLSPSSSIKESWIKSASWLVSILNELKVKYVLIKYLDLPYAYMQDIDLLIEKKEDRQLVFSTLREKGFVPYRSLIFPNPEKIEFVKYEHDNQIQVDIYPEPSWWKISYAPKGLITSKRALKVVSGSKVFVPSPTHDLYIIATHSYAHGVITLTEVAYITKVILNNQINWHHLISIAKQYKLEHAIFVYLFLSNIVMMSMKRNDLRLIKSLEDLGNSKLSQILKNLIIKAQKEGTHFPLLIPKLLRFLSALREILISLREGNKLSIRELSTYWLLIREELVGHYRQLIQYKDLYLHGCRT